MPVKKVPFFSAVGESLIVHGTRDIEGRIFKCPFLQFFFIKGTGQEGRAGRLPQGCYLSSGA